MSDRDFYDFTHEGSRLRLPRVTSIIGIIDKSNALIGWATRLERDALRAGLEEILTSPNADASAHGIWTRMLPLLNGKRAWVKSRDAAANIGNAAHAIIHWQTRKLMQGGSEEGLGPEPNGPDESMECVGRWLDWVKEVGYRPVACERFVYCPTCGVAGTTDAVGEVEGDLCSIDYKTGKAVYLEAHLQVRIYRHCLAREGIDTKRGIILRLPKYPGEPGFEAVPAVDIPYRFAQYVKGAWEFRQTMEGDEIGSVAMKKCEVRG